MLDNLIKIFLLYGMTYIIASLPIHFIFNELLKVIYRKSIEKKIAVRYYFFLGFCKGAILMAFIHNSFTFTSYVQPLYNILGAIIIILGYLIPPGFFRNKEKRLAVSIVLGSLIIIFPTDISIAFLIFTLLYKMTGILYISSMLIGLIFPFIVFLNILNGFSFEERFVYTLFGIMNAFTMFMVHKYKAEKKENNDKDV